MMICLPKNFDRQKLIFTGEIFMIDNSDIPTNNIVMLKDESGNPMKFEFLDRQTYNGEKYVILLPIPEPKDGNVVILRLEYTDGADGAENYVEETDSDVLNAVYELFKEHCSDRFDFDM